jgi:hypothetical protein
MGQKFKRGTGRNKGTAHKRKIAPSHNAGVATTGKASQLLAPAEPNTDLSESNIKIANKLTLPPKTVVLFVVFLSKNVTNSSSNSTPCTTNKQAAGTRTISTGNGSKTRSTGTSNATIDETTTVEVE